MGSVQGMLMGWARLGKSRAADGMGSIGEVKGSQVSSWGETCVIRFRCFAGCLSRPGFDPPDRSALHLGHERPASNDVLHANIPARGSDSALFRSELGQARPTSDSVNVGRIRPNVARVRQHLARARSTLARDRPNLVRNPPNCARIRQSSAKAGPEAGTSGPESTNCVPKSVNVDPISTEFGPPGEAERNSSWNVSRAM